MVLRDHIAGGEQDLADEREREREREKGEEVTDKHRSEDNTLAYTTCAWQVPVVAPLMLGYLLNYQTACELSNLRHRL